MERNRRDMRLVASALGAGLIFAAAGCGADSAYKNEPRPPAPIVLTASIGKDRVSVSPAKFGAGPVNLIITNQSGTRQEVTFTSAKGGAGGFEQKTGPINPSDTATVRVDVPEGSALVKVSRAEISEATLDVGPERSSAQNKLLLP